MQCTGSPLGWTLVNNWAIVQLYSLDASALHTNGTKVLLIHISEAVILVRSFDFNLQHKVRYAHHLAIPSIIITT